jgi:hypothetical protein
LNNMKKLYIACALTNVQDDKREEFERLIFWLKTELSKNFEILEFVGIGDLLNPNPMSPQEVYEVDMLGRVMKADYLLAICDYPATGLGYEMGVAAEKRGIPVLAFAHKNSKVSRSIVGVTLPNYHFCRYESKEEILAKALDVLTK